MEDIDKRTPIFYGWWIVAASTTVLTTQGVLFYGFGILFPSILEEFHWSRALTSSVYSFQVCTNALFILLTGYLVDRYSPRLIISLSAILLGLGMFLSSLTQEIWHLYLFFGVFVGISLSATYVPPITVVTRWFEEKRGLALGITVTGIGIGGLFCSPVLNWLIQSHGWRAALQVLGVSLGLLTFLAAIPFIGSPAEKGLQPYGREKPPPYPGRSSSDSQDSLKASTRKTLMPRRLPFGTASASLPSSTIAGSSSSLQ